MMSRTKKLSIAFYWHMHQPVYQLEPTGDYLMPWVRLHAVKDYLDMLTILDRHPGIKLNFNFVPVLLDSLIDYGEKGMHDLHSRFTVCETLDEDDKTFILNNFFDSNYETMIAPSPAYSALYEKRGKFTEQDYFDLMALFNLAWTDPVYQQEYPELKALVQKQRGYTFEDRKKIIDIHRDIIRKIIPAYKKFVAENKIEITASPYYHPILPVLINKGWQDDARAQIKKGLDRVEEILGKRPQGMWCSEQSISPETLALLKEQGVKWTVGDEGILSSSINFEFVRDFQGYMEDPYRLLKTYRYNDVNIVFRNATHANLISFEYYKDPQSAAANNLYDRIKTIQSKLLSSPDSNHLLTIAMDGENCWEFYQNDGAQFLDKLYELIENDESLETVLLSDYIAADTPKKLNKLAAGSWINRNFKLWIDEPVKDLAWDYLERVKSDLAAEDNRLAQREVYIAEGSDWFWWYGKPNDSGKDALFDYIFREHLKNVYMYSGLEAPEFLDQPIK